MHSVRIVLPLLAGMLFAGQGVTAAATPITRAGNKAAFVPGEGIPGDDEHTGNDESSGNDQSSGDDESAGDDGAPGAGTITGPRPTRAPLPTQQTLTRSVATSRTNSVLSRRFGRVYTHADHKRVSCRAQGADYVCSLSWRYRQQRYDGRATVSPSGVVKTHVVSRRR
jgi:hypothetical protein